MRDSYPARPGHDILYEQLGLPRPEPGPGDGNKITPRAMHRQLYADHQLLVFVQRIASTEPQKRLRPQPVWVSWNAAVRQWWEADMCQDHPSLGYKIANITTRSSSWRFGKLENGAVRLLP